MGSSGALSKHGNEPSKTIKGWEFIDRLSEYEFSRRTLVFGFNFIVN
jgi:hypothetical protein